MALNEVIKIIMSQYNDNFCDDDVVEVVRAPAYGLVDTGSSQRQCSGNVNTFCFFCAFESSADNDMAANDHPTSMRSLVNGLIEQKREAHAIIQKVYDAYNDNVRNEVVWTRGDGRVVEKPEWTKESIKTHLVTSSEFPEIFSDAIEMVFTNVILSQNSRMMNEDGTADQEVVGQFLSTVKALCQYKESRARLASKQALQQSVSKKTRLN